MNIGLRCPSSHVDRKLGKTNYKNAGPRGWVYASRHLRGGTAREDPETHLDSYFEEKPPYDQLRPLTAKDLAIDYASSPTWEVAGGRSYHACGRSCLSRSRSLGVTLQRAREPVTPHQAQPERSSLSPCSQNEQLLRFRTPW